MESIKTRKELIYLSKMATIILILLNINSFAQENENYKTVKIGSRVWMVENLNADRFRNGDLIPEVKNKKEWQLANKNKQPAWCYYENDPKNGRKYGKLYNWYAVNDPRGLAPEGWRIPSVSDFRDLHRSVKGDGNSLKAIGTGRGCMGKGTNTSGFNAIMPGHRLDNGYFSTSGEFANFWCSKEFNVGAAYHMYIWYQQGVINFYVDSKGEGKSVRCVKE